MNRSRLLKRILAGSRNVRFSDFVGLVESFGFRLSRTSGSHHIFVRSGVTELLNLQNVGGEVKPYPIQQWLRLVERYNLVMEEE